MKRDKVVIIITISIMSIILASIMFAQFKVVNEVNIAQIEYMSEQELKQSHIEWKEKYELIQEKIKDTNKKIAEYEEKTENNEEAKELVKKELTEAKNTFGITNVEGEGIIVTLKDTDERSYDYKDLLLLVNELRIAGAKAISINEQRVVNTTDIVNVAYRYIMVNKDRISSPYVIKAIGDKTYLKSAITIKNGYVDLKEKDGYDISIQEKSNIKINKYSEKVELKYIRLEEEIKWYF